MSIGQTAYRIDAPGKVTGQTLYPADITPAGLLHGKVLFSNQPHARMLAMDLDDALAVPGVLTILTAQDVPVNEYGLIFPDQPVLVGLGSDKPGSDISLWEGDQVAVVIAETAAAAATAAERIHITWEPRPVITDPRQAMRDEHLLHPDKESNAYKHYKFRKGDMAAGWAAAEVIVEGTDPWPDLAFAVNDGPIKLYRHRGLGLGKPYAVRLKGPAGNPAAVGARVELVLKGGARRVAWTQAGSGYLSQDDGRVRFGLGSGEEPESVNIRWPDGQVTTHPAGADGVEATRS